MLIQQSHPHRNRSFTKYRFIHLVFMQIRWSQRKHQTSISDNVSNFVRASSEFKKAFAEMNQQRINDFMRDHGGEWMLWK